MPGAPIGCFDDDGNEVDEEGENALFYPALVSPAEHHALLIEKLQDVADGRIKNLMILMPPGSAKALALDTPIPTPDGWKNMGDLCVGDKVFDETGKPCNVTWVSQIWHNRPVYRVKTDCGDEIFADHDHEWLVRLCGKREVYKIKETWELSRKRSKHPMIKRAGALDLPFAELPVHPYLLGLWLGDGHSSGMRITASQKDAEFLRSELESLGYKTTDQKADLQFGVTGVRGKFVRLGLINDPRHKTHGRKHIPDMYLRASHSQRLALLQGLIDSDGTVCNSRGSTTFCNTNLKLAEQVRELVRTLGVKAGWSESPARLNGKQHGTCYKVSFYLKDSAKLPRKRELIRDQYRTPNTYIEVDEFGIADTVCIEVDSPSHLFLAGKSMTPTHNSTYASMAFPTWFMGYKPRSSIIMATYGEVLARKFGRRCRSIVKSVEYQDIFESPLAGDNKAADDWSMVNGSSYMCGGILSGITGNRADGLIVDDPFKGRESAESNDIREKTLNEWRDSLLTRLKPNGWKVLINTRWHLEDVSGSILPNDYAGESGWITAKDGARWYVICLQAQCTRKDDPLGRKIGEYLWTDWFPVEWWEQTKRTYSIPNARSWNSLYQQTPTIDEGGILKKAAWRKWLKPELPSCDIIIQSLDTAFKTGEENDNSVIQTWGLFKTAGVDNEERMGCILLDCEYGHWSFPELKEHARAHYKQHWPDKVIIEDKASGQSLIQELRKMGIPVLPFKIQHGNDKIYRANVAAAVLEAGHVYYVDRDWSREIISHCAAFPNGRIKDTVDACTQAWIYIRKKYWLGMSDDDSAKSSAPPPPEPKRVSYYQKRNRA